MSTPRHHITDALMSLYRLGGLPTPFAVTVAAHLSLCNECRATYEASLVPGGLLLEMSDGTPLSPELKSSVMGMLDDSPSPSATSADPVLLPQPVRALLAEGEPNWRRVAPGSRQAILQNDSEGSLRLLEFAAGQTVPEHSHGGNELTLILQGSFSDVTGTYRVGDLQIADDTLDHAPKAAPGMPCICLAATDAPLKFRGLIPRLLQPFLRI
ncbi:ChrR family anti-sigma-E factor [Qingshengfaniella alkalisoli]|uniref:Transcriptional regulator n=1 Tax=Qingshengfaniella alkalisoli TaxID=2599296 RepID=A0A5B8I8Y9_9RHOB|nr:ChrR family anti-sigma-E factor [Qingshengfaniella alkalisoli]QDY70595.1 transcriptional regulator [Qingshengfaniella alkalisoli]